MCFLFSVSYLLFNHITDMEFLELGLLTKRWLNVDM